MNINNNIENKTTTKIKKHTNILDIENIEDIEFIKYIQSYEDDEDDDELDKLFDSLDDDKDIKQKKIKSIQDIQEECEKNKQHFHITPEEFDNMAGMIEEHDLNLKKALGGKYKKM